MTKSVRSSDPLLQPFALKHLQLRNRVISTAHAPAFAEDGHPKDRYRLYHEEKAKGGLALTIVGGSTNVAPDSPSVFGQLYAGDDSIIPWFEKLTEGVKSHGAAVMCQITHMGRRTSWDTGDWLPVIGPSARRERAHRSMPKIAEKHDLERIVQDFAAGALRCKQGGFDGIEILSHSHLLGQFLSPLVNDREDEFGGSLENRLRLSVQVLEAVRAEVGSDFIVGMRITGDERQTGGLTVDDCTTIAKHLEATAHVDFFNILAGAPYDDLGLAGWVPPMGMPSAQCLTVAQKIRTLVKLPVFCAGGINDLATARHALREGMVDMVGMTRAHLADPYLVSKVNNGQEDRIRSCVGLGYCVDRVNQGKDAVCGQNAVSGREGMLRHNVAKTSAPLKIVVVGGGPCGMEATRLAAEAGHQVHLFEATDQLGGQLKLASMGTLRRQVKTVLDWLTFEVMASEARIHLSTYAESADILGLEPDLIIVATGGWPSPLECVGSELVLSSWDLLGGSLRVSGEVFFYDVLGDQSAVVTADVLSGSIQNLVFATPDTRPLAELGPTTQSVSMKHLYERGVTFLPNKELHSVVAEGKRKKVSLKNTLTQEVSGRLVDHVIVENGSRPIVQLYDALVPFSSNLGIMNLREFSRGKVELPKIRADGEFAIVRLGDATASRNIHAAIFDAARLIQGLG
jgi:2,4-dienoyl-CoA reductase-like NADH-dependent reductase (Old Yellow Enzyme family)